MKGVENWLKSVSAFANGTGGVLVFGGEPEGLISNKKVRTMVQKNTE